MLSKKDLNRFKRNVKLFINEDFHNSDIKLKKFAQKLYLELYYLRDKKFGVPITPISITDFCIDSYEVYKRLMNLKNE